MKRTPLHLMYQGFAFAGRLLPCQFIGMTPGQIKLTPGGPDAVGFVISLN